VPLNDGLRDEMACRAIGRVLHPPERLEIIAMNTSPSTDLRQTALDCVSDMGDVFWDYKAARDAPLQFREPHDVAAEAIERTLREVVLDVLSTVRADSILRSEYETLVNELPKTPTDDQIIGWLVANADWTERGASEVLRLARAYGRFILRNALAEAINIEDGSAGLLNAAPSDNMAWPSFAPPGRRAVATGGATLV
jgi:hypothetical protein